MITVQDIKSYLKIGYNDDDTFLAICLETATQYLRNAVDDFDTKIANPNFEKIVNFILLPIIQDMYDNRMFSTSGDEADVERYKILVNSFILQLQYCTF